MTAQFATYDRESLDADARAFAQALEDAHPDPYLGHGGRVAFHRRLEELTRNIPDDGESLDAFHRRLQRFAARIGDGHTAVLAPDIDDGRDGKLPVAFRVVGDGLYIEAVYEESLTPLLGGRLRAVNGVPVAELLERHAALASADNRYGRLTALGETLVTDLDTLDRLLDDEPVAPTLTVETTECVELDISARPLDREDIDPVATLDSHLSHPETDGEPAFRLLDGGETALLRLPDCTSHREHHEIMAAVGRDGGDVSDSREAYRRIIGEPVPDDRDDAIASLPAASDVFADMAETMAAAETEALVIDVRGNGGGSSVLAYLLVYLLHGWEGIVTATSDQYDVGMRSELYHDQYGDDGPLGEADTHAGYDFDAYFAPDEQAAQGAREQFMSLSSTLAATFEDDVFAGRYRPDDVVVVTDAETFSAGVEPAILLSKLGATVVGGPSGQSPNGPRDRLQGELLETGLAYNVSTRHHVFCPGEDGDVFDPDVWLTPDRFRALDSAADAGVRLALDYLAGDVPSAGEWD